MKTNKKIMLGAAMIVAVGLVSVFGGDMYSKLQGSLLGQYNNMIDLDNPQNQLMVNAGTNTRTLWNEGKGWTDCVYTPVFQGGGMDGLRTLYGNNTNTDKIGVLSMPGYLVWYNPSNPLSEFNAINYVEPFASKALLGFVSLLLDTRSVGQSANDYLMTVAYEACPSDVKNVFAGSEFEANTSCVSIDNKALTVKVRVQNGAITQIRSGTQVWSSSDLGSFADDTGGIQTFLNPFAIGMKLVSGDAQTCNGIQTYENGTDEASSWFYSKKEGDNFTFSWDGNGIGNVLTDVTYSIDFADDAKGNGAATPALGAQFIQPDATMSEIYGSLVTIGANNQSITFPYSILESTAFNVNAGTSKAEVLANFSTKKYWRVCYNQKSSGEDWTYGVCGPWVKMNK